MTYSVKLGFFFLILVSGCLKLQAIHVQRRYKTRSFNSSVEFTEKWCLMMFPPFAPRIEELISRVVELAAVFFVCLFEHPNTILHFIYTNCHT